MDEIRAALMNFFEPAFEQEFWAKNGCYDHYILCRVFGGMGRFRDIMKAEKGTERITFRDTNEVRRQRPNISLPMQPEREKHIAINDARYEREIYNILTNSDE